MVFKPRLYNLLCPTFYINTKILNYTDNIKYLGFTLSSDKKDDNHMLRQMRVFYTKAKANRFQDGMILLSKNVNNLFSGTGYGASVVNHITVIFIIS